MAANSSGQVSYLILDSLASGSKYGLEIIEYISNKTGGNYILKKPTLYSSLTRMEKKGLISSSYWGESELGGKRHYYSITNEGKKNLEILAREFAAASFADEEKIEKEESSGQFSFATNTNSHQSVEIQQNEEYHAQSKPVFLKQNNLFDLVKTEEETPQHSTQPSTQDSENIIENQMDIFSMPAQAPATDKQPSALEELVKTINKTEDEKIDTAADDSNIEETSKTNFEAATAPANTQNDDGKLLESDEYVALTPLQQEQNQRLYDTSSELKKYRKKKSFSENQIEMAVVYERQEDIEIQKSRIEELKASILNLKNPNFNQKVEIQEENLNSAPNPSNETSLQDIHPSTEQPTTFAQSTMFAQKNEQSSSTFAKSAPPKEEEEARDDGVFVTDRMDANEIPIQKKILPTNIEVNIYDDNLPAPKRNTSLEPTYKDMMAKLFERKKRERTSKTRSSFCACSKKCR